MSHARMYKFLVLMVVLALVLPSAGAYAQVAEPQSETAQQIDWTTIPFSATQEANFNLPRAEGFSPAEWTITEELVSFSLIPNTVPPWTLYSGGITDTGFAVAAGRRGETLQASAAWQIATDPSKGEYVVAWFFNHDVQWLNCEVSYWTKTNSSPWTESERRNLSESHGQWIGIEQLPNDGFLRIWQGDTDNGPAGCWYSVDWILLQYYRWNEPTPEPQPATYTQVTFWPTNADTTAANADGLATSLLSENSIETVASPADCTNHGGLLVEGVTGEESAAQAASNTRKTYLPLVSVGGDRPAPSMCVIEGFRTIGWRDSQNKVNFPIFISGEFQMFRTVFPLALLGSSMYLQTLVSEPAGNETIEFSHIEGGQIVRSDPNDPYLEGTFQILRVAGMLMNGGGSFVEEQSLIWGILHSDLLVGVPVPSSTLFWDFALTDQKAPIQFIPGYAPFIGLVPQSGAYRWNLTTQQYGFLVSNTLTDIDQYGRLTYPSRIDRAVGQYRNLFLGDFWTLVRRHSPDTANDIEQKINERRQFRILLPEGATAFVNGFQAGSKVFVTLVLPGMLRTVLILSVAP